MSWDTGATSSWSTSGTTTEVAGGFDSNAALTDAKPSDLADPHSDGFRGTGASIGESRGPMICHNCGQEGHPARECPEPRKLTMPCFACGEIGHNRAACPTAEPQKCTNCGEIGHKAATCEAPRKLNREGIPEVSIAQAWNMILEASKNADVDDFKIAYRALSMAQPDLNYQDLEKQLRANETKFYLIGLAKEMPITITNVNLQGKSECKYQLCISFSPRPRRVKIANDWPKSVDANLERLGDTGERMEVLQSLCRNCGALGHISKSCPHEKVEKPTKIEIACSNCDEAGHRQRDCPKPRSDRNACRNCGEPGHRAAECDKPRDESTMECRRCGQVGHSGKNCPDAGPSGCRNCGEEGHVAKECDKPRNPDTIQCRNCDKYGHVSRECPEPKDWSKVKCSNCGEMGHGRGRCKAPAKEGGDDGFGGSGGFGDAPSGKGDGFGFDSTAADGGESTWESGAQTAGGW